MLGSDPFVVVLRRGHPRAVRLDLSDYAELPHVWSPDAVACATPSTTRWASAVSDVSWWPPWEPSPAAAQIVAGTVPC